MRVRAGTVLFGVFVAVASQLAACGSSCGELAGRAEIRNSNDVETYTCLTAVDGSLTVNMPEGLEYIEFPHLQSVTGWVRYVSNHDLTSFDMPLLESVGTVLDFADNENLTDLDGLPALQTVGEEYLIRGNLSLEECAAENLLAQLQGFAGIVEIERNGDSNGCV